MATIRMKCPYCEALNELNVHGSLPSDEEVSCSHCKATLGRWGELVSLGSDTGISVRSFDDGLTTGTSGSAAGCAAGGVNHEPDRQAGLK